MSAILRHLRHRPTLLAGLATAVPAALLASRFVHPVTAVLVGWDAGLLAYGAVLLPNILRSTPDTLRRRAAALDGDAASILAVTVGAALVSLGAIVLDLARAHGTPHAVSASVLAGLTVVLSWCFVHTIYATHYAHAFWRDGSGLSFPGNDRPDYGEFLYFSFCLAVASQVSDVSTQTAAMRRLVLVHSLVAYLFNTAIIALGVNIAASLAG
ncbi:MAG: DUF1345 domain-containing protein [Gluconacetobacter diazotrophicus]|nr:DUF1345 domain-containing protein [Gluconacetobacter diazotrophicus]